MNKTRAGEGAGLVGSEENGNPGHIDRPAQTVQAVSISEIISEIARSYNGDDWSSAEALSISEDVAFKLRRRVPALSSMGLLEVEAIVKDAIHRDLEDALREVIGYVVEGIIGDIEFELDFDRCWQGSSTSARRAVTIRAYDKTSLGGWPAQLLAEISAAPCRRVAAALVACSQDAIDALPEPEREALFAQLQDIIAELPATPAELPQRSCGISHRGAATT
jgi:hypothetical protein